jgi:ketosteroid isomerase-like protein
MIHPNEELVRAAIAAGTARDIAAFSELISESFVLHIPGTTLVSGSYEGLAGFGAAFAKMAELTGGRFEVEVLDVLASRDHAAGVFAANAARDGRELQWRLINLYRIVDGKIAEVWQHPYEFGPWNDFWS